MKSVLVTGATTPLGRRLCTQLLAENISVLATAIEDESAARLLLPDRVQYAPVDFARTRNLHDLVFGPVREHSVDTVFHLATHRPLDAKGEKARVVNVEALRALLSFCDGHSSIKRFVYRSFADVYRVEQRLPSLVSEDHPLEHAPDTPQWLRDRVEADLLACAKMGMAQLQIVVLRLADIFHGGTGSQIYDYLRSRVCLHPFGFDPMINLLSLDDATSALFLAGAAEQAEGVINIPGADTLPLTLGFRLHRRVAIGVPGPLLSPLYALRRRVLKSDFSYRLNQGRLHFPVVLNGKKAREQLGFVPRCSALQPNRSGETVTTHDEHAPVGHVDDATGRRP
jgi:nucleoside-diphosphate-sugar epimerase